MCDARSGVRELGFLELLGELHALIGKLVGLEVGAAGRPLAVSTRGPFSYLLETRLDMFDGNARVAFAISGAAGVSLTLSEREVVSATAWGAAGADGRVHREIQIGLAGGGEVFIAECGTPTAGGSRGRGGNSGSSV